ncbi:MAG: HD domain-containing protein [Intestinibacter sp.]
MDDIAKQLLECLKYKNTSSKIEELDEKGLLEEIVPNIKDMKEVGKCRYHIVNSFQHSVYTLAYFESILKTDGFLPKHLEQYVWEYLNSTDESGFPILQVLKLGVFLHDIGKPSSKTIDSKGVTHFKGHDLTGGDIVLKLGRDLGLSEVTTQKLFKYVRYHMFLLFIYKGNNIDKESLWREFDKLGDDIIGIILLGYCDLVATRNLLNPLEDNGIIKTYMEFILTVYFHKYKTDKEI